MPPTNRRSSGLSHALLPALVLLFAGLSATPSALVAQSTSNPLFTFKVKDLTSETRDRIALELGERGDAHLRFACVPAGILVIEPLHTAARQDVRQHTMNMLLTRTRARDISELSIGIDEAESMCAMMRKP